MSPVCGARHAPFPLSSAKLGVFRKETPESQEQKKNKTEMPSTLGPKGSGAVKSVPGIFFKLLTLLYFFLNVKDVVS